MKFFIGSKFNQPIDMLPSSITHLTFGLYFNQPVDDFPSSIQHLTFNYFSKFDKSLNNLPINLEFIRLLVGYINKNSNIPPKLSVINCHIDYPCISDYNTDIKIITYR